MVDIACGTPGQNNWNLRVIIYRDRRDRKNAMVPSRLYGPGRPGDISGTSSLRRSLPFIVGRRVAPTINHFPISRRLHYVRFSDIDDLISLSFPIGGTMKPTLRTGVEHAEIFSATSRGSSLEFENERQFGHISSLDQLYTSAKQQNNWRGTSSLVSEPKWLCSHEQRHSLELPHGNCLVETRQPGGT